MVVFIFPSSSTGVRRPAPKPLGLQNGRIRNSAISASSRWNRYHAAWLARLKRPKRGRYAGAWCAKVNNHQQWLQVDFRVPKKVVAVATQGRHDYNQWVTLYYLRFSVDGTYFATYRKNGKKKVSLRIKLTEVCDAAACERKKLWFHKADSNSFVLFLSSFVQFRSSLKEISRYSDYQIIIFL